MQYAHNENWLLTGEDDGKLKYWKPNLECVKVLCYATLTVLCILMVKHSVCLLDGQLAVLLLLCGF